MKNLIVTGLQFAARIFLRRAFVQMVSRATPFCLRSIPAENLQYSTELDVSARRGFIRLLKASLQFVINVRAEALLPQGLPVILRALV